MQEEQNSQEGLIRVRTPRGKETIGLVQQRLGAARMRVICLDGKIRICRVPGRFKRRFWIKENDVVLVEPWELVDEKGDIVYKYSKSQIIWLKKKGFLKKLDNIEDF